MSVDLNWETLTSGPDGEELAHAIRDFVHAKFQTVQLPRFIKSVTVHDFEFGSVPPELELKDITDPLPDFYEEDPEEEDDDDDEDGGDENGHGRELEEEPAGLADGDRDALPEEVRAAERRRREGREGREGRAPLPRRQGPFPSYIHTSALRSPRQPQDLGSPFLGVSTPGIPGATTNLHYFQSHLASGLSGTNTPLAAVAGAHLGSGWLDHPGGGGGASAASPPPASSPGLDDGHASGHSRNPSQSSISFSDFGPSSPGRGRGSGGGGGALTPTHPTALREKHSVSTLAPTSAGTSRPPTRDTSALTGSAIINDDDDDDGYEDDDEGEDGEASPPRERRFREPRVEDMQAVFRIRYAGDVRLLLTADILLDYPMPSFVGIPVQLSITGLTFDGVGLLAHMRRRVHFCFLSPEDALAAVGPDDGGAEGGGDAAKAVVGGLLQEIRVESEIGQREGGKQSLKNVGKVESFVLEQVRRIFEDEFVYPSFWTFLV